MKELLYSTWAGTGIRPAGIVVPGHFNLQFCALLPKKRNYRVPVYWVI